MARSHRMTPARRAALRKAQAASARKRRGRGKGKLAAANRSNSRYSTAAKVIGTAAAIGAVAYTAHTLHGGLRKRVVKKEKHAGRERLKTKKMNTRLHLLGYGTRRQVGRARLRHSLSARRHMRI